MARATETYPLYYLPVPDGRLTPKEATRWVNEEAPALLFLANQAMERATDPDVRVAFGNLLYDMSRMASACGEAITSGRSVTVKVDAADSPDGAEWSRQIALILRSWLGLLDDDGALYLGMPAHHMLGAELCRRLEGK